MQTKTKLKITFYILSTRGCGTGWPATGVRGGWSPPTKLKLAFDHLKNLGIKDVIQGDFMFDQSDLKKENICSNIGISFFPREGIFNQLIATGSFELIENEKLKSLLLEIYNHQTNRNYATSYQIDLFAIKLDEEIHQNFRINSEYNYSEGEIYGRPIIKSYIFDEKFYFSNKFYGLLSEGKQNGYDYIRLLDDLSENYKQARIYAQYEIEN